ncbi:MAG: ABC transporter ATP-binding protein [Eubacterium sp.]|nr:ABC transporter ATP-binding protein [Eubacterium sp.]
MRNKEDVIEVTDVCKKFKVYYDKGKTLKEKALRADRNKYTEREVLKEISFCVKKGEAVGLIGQNGCGKSTTLKLLTRIMYPDAGTVELKGRVSSLLELGAGFHPDMSGRENIYINASIFGLRRKEIEKRMDEIINFSELGEYIDNPIRTYSSGMYMRLAFSVAINVNADILLIDEILAVGDVNFQAKCFNKMMEIKKQGTTIVLVSHSMDQVERICERSIWIQEGRIRMDGPSREVHSQYLDFMSSERRKKTEKKPEKETGKEPRKEIGIKTEALENTAEQEAANRRGTGEARIRAVRMQHSGEEGVYASSGETLCFLLDYEVYETIDQAVFGICFIRNDGVRCYGTNTRAEELPFQRLEADGSVSVTFDSCPLLAGKYDVDVTIENAMGDTIDYFAKAVCFEMDSQKKCTGTVWLSHAWNLDSR